MGTDGFTELSPGSGGSNMDETVVTFPVTPTLRKRERIVVAGCLPSELAEVLAVDPASDDFGLVVRTIPSGIQTSAIQYPGTTVSVFSEITGIGPSVETTIVSHVVPAGKTFHALGFISSGTVDAIFRLYISPAAAFLSSERELAGRSTPSELTIKVSENLAAPTAGPGDTVAVRVEHTVTSHQSGAPISASFESTLLGYET